jgi:hypothetical protein
MDSGKPYWSASRIDLPYMGRYDWLYNQPQPRIDALKGLYTAQHCRRKPPPPPSPQDIFEFEHVGCRPSEYRSIPFREPLRGMTAPAEGGRRDIFRDLHTPVQITQRFSGDRIFSVPLRLSTVAKKKRRGRPSTQLRSVQRSLAPIHEVLFEESVDPHEEIDPWGFSRNEQVVAPDQVFRGIRLTVSRLRPPKK